MSLEDKIKNAEETMWPLTMGMTTQKSIEHLLDIMDSMPDDACGDWRSSIAYAIETMRKYQKISDVIKFAVDNELGYEHIGEKVYEVFIYDR